MRSWEWGMVFICSTAFELHRKWLSKYGDNLAKMHKGMYRWVLGAGLPGPWALGPC